MPKQILVYTLAVFLVGPLVLFFWKETHLHGHDHHHHPDEVLLKDHHGNHLRRHENFATWMEEEGQPQSDETLKSADTKTSLTKTADTGSRSQQTAAAAVNEPLLSPDVEAARLDAPLNSTGPSTTTVDTPKNTSFTTKSPDEIDEVIGAAAADSDDTTTGTGALQEEGAGEEQEPPQDEVEDANLVALPLQPLANNNRIPASGLDAQAALMGDDDENDSNNNSADETSTLFAQEEGDGTTSTIQREEAATNTAGVGVDSRRHSEE
jgi:hypothetical protein